MRLVIEQSDFQKLSPQTQRELLEKFAGVSLSSADRKRKGAVGQPKTGGQLWREPFDLTPETAVRLLHGISEPHRARLRQFAEKGGRVSQKTLLAVTNDTDMRALSHFQAVLSRRLRRLIDDPEKRLHLIGWDYAATRWNKDHTEIVDGTYYITDKTTNALQDYFGIKQKAGAGAKSKVGRSRKKK
jgi:hypothetical protein